MPFVIDLLLTNRIKAFTIRRIPMLNPAVPANVLEARYLGQCMHIRIEAIPNRVSNTIWLQNIISTFDAKMLLDK